MFYREKSASKQNLTLPQCDNRARITSMGQISPTIAKALFEEIDNWYGSPALLATSPALISTPCRESIIDGLARFEAMQRFPRLFTRWQKGLLPHYIFRGDEQRSPDGKLLPRMLVLAGHYDRAYRYTPEHWCETPADVKAYLNLPTSEALLVFAHRIRIHKMHVRATHKSDPVMANRSLVRKLRQLIVTADELGQTVSLAQVRRVLFNDSATNDRRPPNNSGSLYDEPDTVHEDT